MADNKYLRDTLSKMHSVTGNEFVFKATQIPSIQTYYVPTNFVHNLTMPDLCSKVSLVGAGGRHQKSTCIWKSNILPAKRPPLCLVQLAQRTYNNCHPSSLFGVCRWNHTMYPFFSEREVTNQLAQQNKIITKYISFCPQPPFLLPSLLAACVLSTLSS